MSRKQYHTFELLLVTWHHHNAALPSPPPLVGCRCFSVCGVIPWRQTVVVIFTQWFLEMFCFFLNLLAEFFGWILSRATKEITSPIMHPWWQITNETESKATPRYNSMALSCTPTYLNLPTSQFLHINKWNLLISTCKENLYAKMEKLKAQLCRHTRQGLKVMLCQRIMSSPRPVLWE